MSNTPDEYVPLPGYLKKEILKAVDKYGAETWFPLAYREYLIKIAMADTGDKVEAPSLFFQRKHNEDHLHKYFVPMVDEQMRMEKKK